MEIFLIYGKMFSKYSAADMFMWESFKWNYIYQTELKPLWQNKKKSNFEKFVYKHASLLSLCGSYWWLIHPYPHIDAFWCHCSRTLLKTLWIKEKLPQCFQHFIQIILLLLEILPSFSLDVFKVVCCNCVVCGKGLPHYTVSLYAITRGPRGPVSLHGHKAKIKSPNSPASWWPCFLPTTMA